MSADPLRGAASRLARLVDVSRRVADTASRNEKTAVLAGALRTLRGDDIRLGLAYLTGRLPQGRIGIGPALLRAAQAPPAPHPTLGLDEVDRTIEALAATTGARSASGRARLLGDLYARATAPEQAFLTRLLTGELRQGALEGVMVEAVAEASRLPAADIRAAGMVAGDLVPVAEAALREGRRGVGRFALQLFTPVKPMLAQPAADLERALAALGEAALEYKFDGARVQVHKAGDEVRVYSRRLNEVTGSVPELVEAARALPAERLILDGEAIALRPDGRPHSFQTTMRRFGRRLEIERLRAELPLTPFYFDCLLIDGDTLLASPAVERFRALESLVPATARAPQRVTAYAASAGDFLSQALAEGHEGVMAKALDAPYVAGRRGSAWLKVKQAHTLDLVVLAAEWGHGRRQGRLSNLHLGARDADGGYVMLGKTFKGMTDAMLAWQTERLLGLAVNRDAYTVYVRPALVVEIAFNDIQESPQYPGGLALRFARVKAYRPDKTPEEADTIDAVRRLHARQAGDGESRP